MIRAMIPEDAVPILRALADGFDPRSGEAFAEPGAWADPNVIRALFAAIAALENPAAEASRPRRVLPEGAGKPWTPEEDRQLATEFETEKDPNVLSELHSRTRGAINARLMRLGLISPKAIPDAP